MKKAILIVLTMLLLVIPVYAAEGDAATDQPIQQEQEPVVVASLEELQAAIDVAEDGDTIYLAAAIGVSGATIETDKKLTIASSNDHNEELLRLYDGATIRGFCFSETEFSGDAFIKINDTTTDRVTIDDCNFEYFGDGLVSFVNIYGNLKTNKANIKNCTFIGATHSAINIMAYTDVVIDSCIFKGNENYLPGGAISSAGKLYVAESIFTDNFDNSGGSVFCQQDLTIANCQFIKNKHNQDNMVYDFQTIGKASIISVSDNAFDYYNKASGEKIELPLIDCESITQFVLLTEEQAAVYFAPELPPQQPGDQNGDDNTTGGEQPPQEPTQPPEGEGADNPDTGDQNVPQQPEQPPQGNEDNPTDTPSQPPELPTEPPQDDTPNNPTDTTPDTPQPPQKPSDGNSSGDDGYIPPVNYYPIYYPVRPSVTVKPTGDSKPQKQPDIPAPAKPQLVCNGAVIDTTRTVVLLGYGDGLLHEDDPLTRAQLATIVFRLLDDASIARYSNTQVAFADVASDAWYAPYVRVIQAAGIVNGVGNGQYDPNGTVTWSQILAILSRFVEPQDYTLQHIQYSGWATQAIQTAVANGWIVDRADFTPDAVISRGELEQLINSVLELYRA